MWHDALERCLALFVKTAHWHICKHDKERAREKINWRVPQVCDKIMYIKYYKYSNELRLLLFLGRLGHQGSREDLCNICQKRLNHTKLILCALVHKYISIVLGMYNCDLWVSQHTHFLAQMAKYGVDSVGLKCKKLQSFKAYN